MTRKYNENETELAFAEVTANQNVIVLESLTVDDKKKYHLYEMMLSFSGQANSSRKQVTGREAVKWLLENQCNHLELHVTPEMVRHSRKFEG